VHRYGRDVRSAALTGLAGRVARDAPRVASGLAVEAAWSATHLLTYPLGLLPGSTARASRRQGFTDLGPHQRGLIHADLDAATTPILLVHGIVDNHSVFSVLDRALRQRGFETVAVYDYAVLTRDVRTAAGRLGEAVATLVRTSGHDRVHVVGHSLGGLLARYFVQRLGGDAYVRTLVTLGTPHGGTELARLAPRAFPLVRQLSPRSPVIRELAEPAPGCRTRFLAFSSDLDHLVVPSRNARIEHPDLDATNVAVRGVGHLSLSINRRVAQQIATALGALDPASAAGPSQSDGTGPQTRAPV
jgi:triacylglycerol lipase